MSASAQENRRYGFRVVQIQAEPGLVRGASVQYCLARYRRPITLLVMQ
jgi:hypothetical protein